MFPSYKKQQFDGNQFIIDNNQFTDINYVDLGQKCLIEITTNYFF